jgi:hypothetical protein
MADFDASDLFEQYYVQYRAEAQTPATTDDEYTIFLRLSKEAITRWSNYDATYWKELFTTAQTNSTGGVVALSTGTRTYAAPTAMREAGGFVRIINASGVIQSYLPIVEPQDVQFRNDNAHFAYFTGNPSQGFTLNLNVAPAASENGFLIDYVYYKKPTYFSLTTDKTEMADPYFIVHRCLANRFRASRNPYTNSAKADAENCLQQMKMDNDSGNWANPWKVEDRSGSTWGESWGSRGTR